MKSNHSLLSKLNPSAKLFSHLLAMCILMAVSDPKATLFIWLLAVSIGVFFGGWTLAYLAKRLLPYLMFFILVFWMMAAFGKGEETLWQWAWFHVTKESVSNGLTIALRMLGFVTYGLLFTSTTDLTQFIMSLIHQCRLSPKWAYGLLAGFRFVPLFQSELAQKKAAHKIRGYKQKNSWKAFIRYSLPLFSQGIRKSERIAIAMEARGFTGTRDRTYYQTTRLSVKDGAYLAGLLFAVTVILLTA
ncbi:energy-coupling factor transporter transmembrane component T family protein [Bacillus swezeyi]|uniref:Energy-coupling factor transporter transmembrane protein EcfT n=1 Tax=Bacillus swezeyi TaxID=1925020 RepID=A0A5M8RMY0_9BACI|nr:energy-coupling factor transporter transmembrane component T [Bacillus swezeyi]KAA6447312.1 energy-coupling factor transporter transmembrane protein EcfT [Bacillus swezeyi]KAA6473002.1 energy-coupling factor transporter transmembrane protein EcfT [Bacillus swezeyi]TYS32857.1 energy-coupling factor transporter transmembrane protein EcfT [Bacillus swezeyi]